MIRANLMPRRAERMRLLGFQVERAFVRAALGGALWAAGAAACTAALETARIENLRREIARTTELVAERAPERDRIRRMALDVARYQEFAREAALARTTGPAVARGIVRIGNAVPARVWLDSLASTADHVDLAGTSQSLAGVGNALDALDRALAGASATLVKLERRDASGTLEFTARISPAGSRP